jgi:hypothetical protein
MRSRATLVALLAVAVAGTLATPALADAPQRETQIGLSVTFPDFFNDGSGQQCAFPVVGHWDVDLRIVTFLDPATGAVDRVVTTITADGTLSNPLSGKSIPDATNSLKTTDYFAPDGSLIKEVEHTSRADPFLHAAYHFGVDAQGNILFDNGRDWFVTATHVIDIQPLCAALS